MKKSKAGGRILHRSSGESSAARTRKKLTGKSEWFRKADQTEKEADEDDDKSLDIWLKAGKTDGKETENCKLETRSVLFVEQSRGGELAKRLREVERRANKIVGYKTKIVEGVGNKLKDLLPNANPWKGSHCGREKCIPCNQPTEQKQDCCEDILQEPDLKQQEWLQQEWPKQTSNRGERGRDARDHQARRAARS